MIASDQKITGILLAGGKSSRMGKEKGFIMLGDKMLYQYPLRVLESLCDEILISTCKTLEIEEDHEQVCDEITDLGPIGGIYTCLKKSSSTLNIILSYDLPMIKQDVLEELLRSSSGHDVVLPAMDPDWPEPLCGIYTKDVADVMLGQIKKGEYAVHKCLSLVQTKIVQVTPNMPFFHTELFRNINTESDLDELFLYLDGNLS